MAKFLILQEYIPQYREAFFKLLSAELEAHDHSLVVGAGEPSECFKARGDATDVASIDLIEIPGIHFRFIGRRVILRSTTAAVRNADYVILEHARRNLDVYRLFIPRWIRNRPIGLWGHGREHVQQTSRVERYLFNLLARRADWYFAYTEGGRNYLVDVCGLNPEKVTVVQNSLDGEELRSQLLSVTADEIAEFRDSIDATGPIVLYLGALDPSKRIDFLLTGAERIRRALGNITLVIAGDGLLRGDVEAAARDTPWVKWIGSAFGRSKAIVLAAADVIANPGRVGLVAIDSFSARLPIVTVDHEFHAPEFEYLVSGNNCVVSDNDIDSFAGAILEVLTEPALRDRLRAGCDRSYAKYSLPAMAENYADGIFAWRAFDCRGLDRS